MYSSASAKFSIGSQVSSSGPNPFQRTKYLGTLFSSRSAMITSVQVGSFVVSAREAAFAAGFTGFFGFNTCRLFEFIRPVARSGNGGVRKIINVDLTSGRWPRWVARYEKWEGGGG